MKILKFIKEPGYLSDLFFIFSLYFNKQYVLTNFINYNKSSEDTEYFNKLINNYLPIPDDLLLFFYFTEDKKNLITQFYYEPYKDLFFDKYSLSTVHDALSDYNQVIDNVLKFYFRNESEDELKKCKDSITEIDKLIKKSKYNGELKSALYSFFISPEPVIQKLLLELMSKEFILAKQYEENRALISQLQDSFDFLNIAERLESGKNTAINLNNFENIYVSFCLNNKNCIKTHFYENAAVLLLGADYKDAIQYLIMQNRLPELDMFGNAISESNRVDILDLMLKKEEITIKDIEQDLGFTGTNAYYHLSLMIKAGMVRTRNHGRTILYSINKNYFHMLCGMLSKYYEKGGENK